MEPQKNAENTKQKLETRAFNTHMHIFDENTAPRGRHSQETHAFTKKGLLYSIFNEYTNPGGCHSQETHAFIKQKTYFWVL